MPQLCCPTRFGAADDERRTSLRVGQQRLVGRQVLLGAGPHHGGAELTRLRQAAVDDEAALVARWPLAGARSAAGSAMRREAGKARRVLGVRRPASRQRGATERPRAREPSSHRQSCEGIHGVPVPCRVATNRRHHPDGSCRRRGGRLVWRAKGGSARALRAPDVHAAARVLRPVVADLLLKRQELRAGRGVERRRERRPVCLHAPGRGAGRRAPAPSPATAAPVGAGRAGRPARAPSAAGCRPRAWRARGPRCALPAPAGGRLPATARAAPARSGPPRRSG